MRFFMIIALCSVLGFGACTAAVSGEFNSATLSQLQQLNHKPDLYLVGPGGDFLITAETQVEIFLLDGQVVSVFASEILTTGDMVVLRGRGQTIPLSSISKVRYTSRY